MKLTDDFDKFIEQFGFLYDISSDFSIENSYELSERLKALKLKSKELIAAEIINASRASMVDVSIIGDFSSGKSSFINSIVKKQICPVDTHATTSYVTKFICSDRVKILKNNQEINVSEYEDIVKNGLKQGDTKIYELEYQYPFEGLRDIALYDTPGFSNPQNANDEQISMQKAKESDVVLLVIDIQNGNISSSLRQKMDDFLKDKF